MMFKRVFLVAGLLFVAPSARADGIYVCDTLVSGACTHFVAVTEGIAAFEGLGLTGEAIAMAVGFGTGVMLLFFGIGLALGSAHRVLAMALGGSLE